MLGFVLLIVLQTPVPIFSLIGIDQKVGTQVNPSLEFRDETGTVTRLGDFFGKRPLLLTPVYYECPMICSAQLNALVRAMKVMKPTVGKDFDIVTISIDPRETPEIASSKKAHYIRDYGRLEAQAGWHFLTGDARSIASLTSNIGFRYTIEPSTGQIAHVSTLITLTPDGRISQYFQGIEYDPSALKADLDRASSGGLGSWVDQALLYCYEYDPATGRYSLSVLRVMRLAAVATMIGLVLVAVRASRQRRLA